MQNANTLEENRLNGCRCCERRAVTVARRVEGWMWVCKRCGSDVLPLKLLGNKALTSETR